MKELEIFKNEEFGEVRSVKIDGNDYFMGSDVAKALGYVRPNEAISAHCRGTVKQGILISGKIQEVNFITEGDIYRLTIRSKLPNAEKFEKWIFDDVLPTIRKTGGYVDNDELFINTYLPNLDETSRLLFKSTLEVVRKQNELIEQQKPLVAFANTVANSSDNIDMNEMAKLIANEKIKLGRNRLFEILRSKKILMHNNTPYQRYIDSKWFKLIETTKSTPYGDKVFTKTLVTGIGQIKIIEMLKEMLA